MRNQGHKVTVNPCQKLENKAAKMACRAEQHIKSLPVVLEV